MEHEITKQEMIHDILEGNLLKENIPEEWLSDRDIIIACIRNHPDALSWIPEKNRGDREIVRISISYGYQCLIEYASEELKNDKDFIIELLMGKCINREPLFQYVPESFKEDDEKMIQVIKLWPYAIKYASNRLKNDQNIILQVMKRYLPNLEHASDEIKNEALFFLRAIEVNHKAIHYFHPLLKNNRNLLVKAIEQSPCVFVELTNKQRTNKYIIRTFLTYVPLRRIRYPFYTDFTKFFDKNRNLFIKNLKMRHKIDLLIREIPILYHLKEDRRISTLMKLHRIPKNIIS